MACKNCQKSRELEATIKAFGGEVSENISKRNMFERGLLAVIGVLSVPFVFLFVVFSALFNKGMVKIPFLKI